MACSSSVLSIRIFPRTGRKALIFPAEIIERIESVDTSANMAALRMLRKRAPAIAVRSISTSICVASVSSVTASTVCSLGWGRKCRQNRRRVEPHLFPVDPNARNFASANPSHDLVMRGVQRRCQLVDVEQLSLRA
jgi:hypothetical protein